MKAYEEIKKIITEDLKITNQTDYQSYLKQVHQTPLTAEQIELLSPDNVDNNDFWRFANEQFGIDCIANTKYGASTYTSVTGNRRNLGLARTIGALNYIEEFKNTPKRLLEIGAGLGSFKNYIETNTQFDYVGVDAFPQLVGVEQTTKEGFLPEKIKNLGQCFDIVYSSNVFQHLSQKQRVQYFKDIYHSLSPDGVFIVNLMLNNNGGYVGADGEKYLCHYGQFTLIPSWSKIIEDLTQHFNILQTTTRYVDYFTNFVCLPRHIRVNSSEIKKEGDQLSLAI
jgi:SAM-dependent methyltransferase